MAKKKGSLFTRQSSNETHTVSFKVAKTVKEREIDINERLAEIDPELKFSLSEVAKESTLKAVDEAERELSQLESKRQKVQSNDQATADIKTHTSMSSSELEPA